MPPAALDAVLHEVVRQRLQLTRESGGDCQQGEPVGLFLPAGAVCGVASPVDFRDEIVQRRCRDVTATVMTAPTPPQWRGALLQAAACNS
ncbi:hypothetical protein GCM10018780_83730 [Streptomyces lanatus]|nr:hypothetical protein GCM10018780_83730 [Streptomyces lanatus]